jgi:hypothetical protein
MGERPQENAIATFERSNQQDQGHQSEKDIRRYDL